MLRQLIKGRIEDNPSLVEDDPMHELKLAGLGSPELVRAMRFGDRDIIEGIVDKDVDAAKLLLGLLDEIANVFQLEHVCRNGKRAGDLVFELFKLIRRACREDDSCSLSGKEARRAQDRCR